jgi:phage tail-like protein
MNATYNLLLEHLPAIFRSDSDSKQVPLLAVLELWQNLYFELEEVRNFVPELFDSDKAPDSSERDFLSWLAHWVALNPSDVFYGEPSRRDSTRLREIIRQAASLYTMRGTLGGLHDLVKVFLQTEICIAEWTRPAGLAIGLSSSVGLDTFLTNGPPLECSFTVRVQPPVSASKEGISGLEWLQIPMAGQLSHTSLTTVVASEYQTASTLPGLLQLRQLRRLLDTEKPAHTHCFIGFDRAAPEQTSVIDMEALIVGVSSTIGMCWIEGVGQTR